MEAGPSSDRDRILSLPSQFPFFHLVSADYSLELSSLSTLNSAQLCAAWIIHPDYDPAIHSRPIWRLLRARRERGRSLIGKRLFGVYASEAEKAVEGKYPKFELIDLGYPIPSDLEELSSAQLAALPLHPDYKQDIMEWPAETIFTSRRERDLNNNLILPEPQAVATGAPFQHSRKITNSVQPCLVEALVTQTIRSLTPPGSPPRRKPRRIHRSPSIPPPSPRAPRNETPSRHSSSQPRSFLPLNYPSIALASTTRQRSRSNSLQSNLYSITSLPGSPHSLVDQDPPTRPPSPELVTEVVIPVEASPPPELPPPIPVPPRPKAPVNIRKQSSGLLSQNTIGKGSKAVAVRITTRVIKVGNKEKGNFTKTVAGPKTQSTLTKSLKPIKPRIPSRKTVASPPKPSPITKNFTQKLVSSDVTSTAHDISGDLMMVKSRIPLSQQEEEEPPWTRWLRGLGCAMRAEMAQEAQTRKTDDIQGLKEPRP